MVLALVGLPLIGQEDDRQPMARGVIPEREPFRSLEDDPYTLTAEDAPFYMLFDSWLVEAWTWYEDDHRPDNDDPWTFASWCEDYGIDPSWPSCCY